MIRNKKFANSAAFDVGASGSGERDSQKSSNLDSGKFDQHPKSCNRQGTTNNKMDVDPAPREKILTYPSSNEKDISVGAYRNCVSQEKSDSGEALLHRLRGIKRQRSSNSVGLTPYRSRNEEISIDEFDKSVRALDRACNTPRPLDIKNDPLSRLGLVPFGVFENLSSPDVDHLPRNRPPSIHLSFDEDNEEQDMFAEAKDDDVEDVEEFGNWDYKNRESSTFFHGFTSRESQHSDKIAARWNRREELEKLEIYEREEEAFRGYSTEDMQRSIDIKNTWNFRLKKYEPECAIDTSMEFSTKGRSNVEKDTIVSSLPRIRELKNMELTRRSDKKLTNPAVNSMRKSRSLPSKSIEKIVDDPLANNFKINHSPKSDSSMSVVTRDFCGFSTASGRKIDVSEEAFSRAQKMYKDMEILEQETRLNNEIMEKNRIDDKECRKNEINGKTRIDDETEIKSEISLDLTSSRGGELKISKELLPEAKAQFDEIQDDIIVNLIEPDFTIENEIFEKITKPNSSIVNEEMKKSFAGFTTARGGELKISKEALSMAQAQFDKIEIDLNENSTGKNARSTPGETKKDTGFGFTTAGGRQLKISKEALSKTEAQFDEIEKELNEYVSQKNPQISKSEKKSEISFGFTTAKGGKLKISNEALSKAKAQFDESIDDASVNITETNLRFRDTERKKDSIIGFTTAAGRELKISKKALSQAKAQFVDIETEFADIAFVTSPKINPLVANVSSMSSGRSKIVDHAIDVSSRMPMVEENLTNELCNIDSLEFDDFSMDQSSATRKRKFDDIDDDTPMRRDPPWKRKKGRYVSDLQGRKLFVEHSANISIVNESENNNSSINETILSSSINEPEINQIVDEIDASAAALIEDEELSREMTISQSRISCDVKIATETDEICEISKNPCKKLEPGANESQHFSNSRKSIDGSESKIAETNVNDGKTKILEIQTESIPDDLTFDSQFSQDLHHSQVINKFIMETIEIMEARMAMTSKQDEAIRAKRRSKPQACDGSLYELRLSKRDSRFSWRQLTDGEAPVPRECFGKFMDSEVLSVTANSAASYSFCCADFYGGKNVRINVEGIKVGDGAFLILDERNCAGAREFERAFLASPGVDPNLVPAGWVKNHYRWIVWKLASMDRVKFGHKLLPRMLTPNRVMLELKYRYDREIYRSQWPPLRRILEKNEDAAARLVLCVAGITDEDDNNTTPAKRSSDTPSAHVSNIYRMKLTDGWYCIYATIDLAMVNCIKSGKIKEGTKLVTFGAKAMNLDQGCSVLEIPEDVTLRIHTNSTRRVRWDTKLDFCHPNRGPMSLNLKSVKSNGGAICKLIVAVARLYPILYREKLPDGQFVFRNARCDEEAALAHEARCQSKMEEICENARNDFQLGSDGTNREEEIRENIASKLRECLPPPRDVVPVLKIRIAEGETSAMMTIWSTDRETDQVFEEGSSVIIYNCFAARQRCNELQITAGRNTVFNREVTRRIAHPERIFTSLMDIGESGFNPVYGEFDTVGIVSSIGPAPHGMKNFETINLACPRSENDDTSDFLSILFWQGVSTHGYSKILTVGTLVACSNLEWRRNTSRSIPTSYCTERSVFTKNPRKKHLAKPFESLRELIKDPFAYATTCAISIQEEIAKKTSLRTPGSGTPYRGLTTNNPSTPGWSPRDPGCSIDVNCTPRNNSKKASIMRRIEKLEVYGEPPKLPSIVINNSSPKVLSDFRSLVFTPVTKS